MPAPPDEPRTRLRAASLKRWESSNGHDRCRPRRREIRTLLNQRKTAEARDAALAALQAGTAKAETQKLAAELPAAGKRRPLLGRTWGWRSGEPTTGNAEGVAHKERLPRLEQQFNVSAKHVEACVTLYRRARAAEG